VGNIVDDNVEESSSLFPRNPATNPIIRTAAIMKKPNRVKLITVDIISFVADTGVTFAGIEGREGREDDIIVEPTRNITINVVDVMTSRINNEIRFISLIVPNGYASLLRVLLLSDVVLVLVLGAARYAVLLSCAHRICRRWLHVSLCGHGRCDLLEVHDTLNRLNVEIFPET
jgi:hypothetical protein